MLHFGLWTKQSLLHVVKPAPVTPKRPSESTQRRARGKGTADDGWFGLFLLRGSLSFLPLRLSASQVVFSLLSRRQKNTCILSCMHTVLQIVAERFASPCLHQKHASLATYLPRGQLFVLHFGLWTKQSLLHVVKPAPVTPKRPSESTQRRARGKGTADDGWFGLFLLRGIRCGFVQQRSSDHLSSPASCVEIVCKRRTSVRSRYYKLSRARKG